MGGADKWAAVRALAVSSRSPYFSSDAVWKKPNLVRIDSWSDAVDQTDTRSYDGTSGWRLFSAEGSLKPRSMSAQEVSELRDEFDSMLPLIDYKTKGYKVVLLGTAPVGGQSAYKLELTRPGGEVMHIFVDVKTGLEVQRVRWARSPAGDDLELVLPVGDYREVGGLMLPHRVGPAARTYDVNGAVPDSRFQRPGGLPEREFAAAKVTGARDRLLPVGSMAPEWTLKDPRGRAHRSSDFRDKVVVMDFWATWCAPCHRLMPALQRLHDDYASRGVVVLGISTSERGGDPAQLMKDRGYTYTLLVNGESIMDAYHVAGMPVVYVVGGNGRILHADAGADEEASAARRKVIDDLLHGRGR
ncbi:MAG: hypothetical protein A3H96_13125 [Acidobacteria bacterium RIFCSPLOWO2_02_FULL_67_36]|nr:MAG: hypothetical protein A3H96_13125 [Acidobacteria bacterium RIFCSPLOWO2_02_FULL_67_36]OFW23560.1 MAG: hypothetical protein A3G21_06430 [Acidobacteria bacterium RIFCSPLOWO2_12_FULL_66_21]